MKKTIRLAILGTLALSGLQAADLILEPSADGTQSQAQLQLRLAAEQETAAGLQFDLEYDDSLVKVEVLPGTVAALAEKVVQSASPSPGRLRILVIGFNQNVITNGVVALVRVSPKGETSSSPATKVRLAGTTATDRSGADLELVARGEEQIVQAVEKQNN